MTSVLETWRPAPAFIEEVRKVLARSPDLTLEDIIAVVHPQTSLRTEFVAQLGWALAEIAAIEDAERLPGTPFGKRLTQALKDAPSFDQVGAPSFPQVESMQYTEAPALTFWREAYRLALGALLDPTLHGSTTSGVNVRAKEIADQAAFDFFETERTGLAEIAAVAHGARKEPRS